MVLYPPSASSWASLTCFPGASTPKSTELCSQFRNFEQILGKFPPLTSCVSTIYEQLGKSMRVKP
jgi:hypothetical protein